MANTTTKTPLRIRSEGAKAIAAAPDRDELISISTAAEIVGVDPLTIRRWISQNRLAARRFGPKLLRIRMSDLEAMGTDVLIAS